MDIQTRRKIYIFLLAGLLILFTCTIPYMERVTQDIMCCYSNLFLCLMYIGVRHAREQERRRKP